MKNLLRRGLIPLLFLFLCSIEFTLPISFATIKAANPIIQTAFISESGIKLEELTKGAAGQGVILYYLAENGPEKPSLVVRLSKQKEEDFALANVYQALPGENIVPVKIDKNGVLIDKQVKVALRFTALAGYWVKDGKTNYNLDIRIFEPSYSMWGSDYNPKTGFGSWAALVKPSAEVVNIQVRDPQFEGLPKWEYRNLLPIFPGTTTYIRTNYSERKCNTPTTIDSGITPLWPYVAITGGFEQAAGKLAPPIVMDWEKSKLLYFSELVPVRNQNCSYSLYTLNDLQKDKLNKTNFEAPFAFYDLSGMGNGHPNLILRTERYYKDDPLSIGLIPKTLQQRTVPSDFETVRYSWKNGIGDGSWDYKVEVMGLLPYNQETSIADGEFKVDAPDYQSFPSWVINNNWPVITFIDTEGRSYLSSEGIYDWSPRDIGVGYLFGWVNQPAPDMFSNITEGYRGEYRLDREAPPQLYFSPIDQRLHLMGASGGLWNLGNNRVLKSLNLDGGRYINGWVREVIQSHVTDEVDKFLASRSDELLKLLNRFQNLNVPEAANMEVRDLSLGLKLLWQKNNVDLSKITQITPEEGLEALKLVTETKSLQTSSQLENQAGIVEEALYTLDGYLIYSGPNEVVFKKAIYNPSLFEVLPPTDNSSWQASKDKLEPYKSVKRDPMNLLSWLDAFPGESTNIPGARISSLQATKGGFRFMLSLPDGLKAQQSQILPLDGLKQGDYIVTYDGQFNIVPAISPSITLTIPDSTLQQYESQVLKLNFLNNGNVNLDDNIVEIRATSPQGKVLTLASQRLTIQGGTTTIMPVTFSTTLSGEWLLTALITTLDGHTMDLTPVKIKVLVNNTDDPLAIQQTVSAVPSLVIVIILLLTMIIVAVSISWRHWQSKVNDSAK